MMYKVYILFQDAEIVYVGCTGDLKRRIECHQRDKEFDSYRVQYQNMIKENALAVEKSIINFLIDNYRRPIYNKQQSSYVHNNHLIKL